MYEVIFTLYNHKTEKIEETFYLAETIDEALGKLWNDYSQSNYTIEDWEVIQ